MSIKHFMQEIEKGLKAPVYFLYGEDPYLLKEASLMAEGTVPEGERDFLVNLFDLDGIDDVPPLEQIMDEVNTVPFMGNQKVVIIENIQELAKKDMQHLERYAANPSPHSILMLLHRGSPKAQFKELMKKVKATPLDIRPQELPLWIKEKAVRKGFEITGEAVEYLLGIIGPDIGLLSSELEKVALMGKSRIDTADIKGIVRGNTDCDVFDLVNALREIGRAHV
jgi:DNA polymerase-3 subunit delta